MKKFITIITTLGLLTSLTIPGFAQRQVDLSLEAIVSPENNLIIENGATANISFTIKNNGTDTLFAGDTLLVFGNLTGNIPTNPGGIIFNNTSPVIEPGISFTIQLQQPNYVNNRTEPTDTVVELCLTLAAMTH